MTSVLPCSESSCLNDFKRSYIALHMRSVVDGQNKYDKYKYAHSHIIFDELCMLIQTRAFYLGTNACDIPVEIALEAFDEENKYHTIVREIAFGPYCSEKDRCLALYFDIRNDQISICDPKEKKRSDRTKKRLNKNKAKGLKQLSSNDCEILICHPTTKTSYWSDILERDLPISFDYDEQNDKINQPFKLCVPKDEDSYTFITDVLKFHVNKCLSSIKGGDMKIKNIADEKEASSSWSVLEKKYNSLMNHFDLFYFPINEGRKYVDETTLVPRVDTLYNMPPFAGKGASFQEKIWEVFLTNNKVCSVKCCVFKFFIRISSYNFSVLLACNWGGRE